MTRERFSRATFLNPSAVAAMLLLNPGQDSVAREQKKSSRVIDRTPVPLFLSILKDFCSGPAWLADRRHRRFV
jgi:hypothetical protein